ncbi:MAG: hypothetical protein K0S88_363 [Actinomycetia bacterium]|nr:hypothetical protein [Actinomycetes bacterium]
MDGEHFDSLVKRLTQTRLTRWEALRVVLASAALGFTAASRTDDTAAKKQSKQSKQTKQSKQPKQGNTAGKQGGNKQGDPKGGETKQGNTGKQSHSEQRSQSRGGCRDTGQACTKNSQCCSNQCDNRVCAPKLGCEPDDSACQQNSDCCGGNCFGQRCAPKQSTCSGQTCSPTATGCCAGDAGSGGGCCQPPNNQCNTTGGQAGLCCAPNCNGRECGPDGCGNDGTCGECAPGQTCTNNGQCQGQPTCSPQTCPNGCCDKNGNCQPGNTEQACGRGGQACVNCPGSATSCQNGECQPTCSEATCPNGCCDATGKCQPGDQTQACGLGGVPCVRCQAGQFCCSTPACDEINRRGQCACGIDSCPDGCCEEFTTCRPGTTNEFCGLGGLECLTCDPKDGEVCAEVEVGSGGDVERLCICTPETCPNGCCSGGPGEPGSCLANRAPQCGIGGALCQLCDNSSVCNAQGQCVCSRSCPRCQTCDAGTGQCQPLVCPPPADQCHAAGTCDPGTGECSNPTVANGTPCIDGNPLCINGQCCTAGHEVVNGGCFQITQITNGACTGCSNACQTCGGSIDGSPNFLCANETTDGCQSNAGCPPGQACQTQIETCLAPC